MDAHGIVLGGGMGIFTSEQGNWLSMSSAHQFSNRVNHLAPASNGRLALQPDNPTKALLLERARVLHSALSKIASKVEKNNRQAHIRGGALARQMTHAVNIINSRVDVPVIKLTLGGFDTHENQLARHNKLLKEAAHAISGLRRELMKSGQWQNTLLISYSEFGRRVGENKSAGTDHGTAAPHFVAGGSINGGLYGTPCDLGQLKDFDMQHTMDYRSVYSCVLNDWLQLPSNAFDQWSDDRLNSLLRS